MRNKIFDMDKKILAVFIVLFLSNVLLWFYLLTYNSNAFTFDSGKLNYIFNTGPILFTIASVLIFFAFISSRLPKLLAFKNKRSYEIGYLLILGLLSLSMANFYATVNQNMNLFPYMSMVNLLATILLVLIVASHFKSFRVLITNDYTRKDQLKCMVIFLILGILSSLFAMKINNHYGDIRIMTVMISGLFGGPIIGIPTAVLSSLTLLSTGVENTFYYVVSTIICGVISSAIYVWNGRKLLRAIPSAILIFLFIGFEMLMIVLMAPKSVGVPIVLDIYLPMLFAGLMGIILFEMVIAEIKMDAGERPLDAESEIKELKASLKEYEEKIERLEEEIEKK